jgi:hypothetical protein
MADVVILAAYTDVAGNVAPAGFDDFMAIPRIGDTLRVASHKELTDELEQATGYRYDIHSISTPGCSHTDTIQ